MPTAPLIRSRDLFLRAPEEKQKDAPPAAADPASTDAAPAPAAAPAESTGAKVFTFIASDGAPDRYNDRISPGGWKLDNFHANPVILYAHNDASGGWGGGGTCDLPIGTGRAYVDSNKLLVDVTFDAEDEFAKQVQGKVERGVLRAVSVRYLMLDYDLNDIGGYDSKAQELLEISVVVIPGNPRALIASKALAANQETDVRKEIGSLVAEVKTLRADLDAARAELAEVKAMTAPTAPPPAQSTEPTEEQRLAALERQKAEKAAAVLNDFSKALTASLVNQMSKEMR